MATPGCEGYNFIQQRRTLFQTFECDTQLEYVVQEFETCCDVTQKFFVGLEEIFNPAVDPQVTCAEADFDPSLPGFFVPGTTIIVCATTSSPTQVPTSTSSPAPTLQPTMPVPTSQPTTGCTPCECSETGELSCQGLIDPGTTDLVLSNRGITAISAASFVGLEALEYLNLGR